MAKNLSNLILYQTEEEYKRIYIDEFVKKEVTTHDGIIVEFKHNHFDHIFYRNKKVAPIFDKPMAQRMMQLKDILQCNVTDIEVYENFNDKSCRNERSYVYVYKKICIILGVNKVS